MLEEFTLIARASAEFKEGLATASATKRRTEQLAYALCSAIPHVPKLSILFFTIVKATLLIVSELY